MRCSSCDKAKAELFPRKSALLRGMTLYMCRSCLDNGLEPRWVIILAGRRDGTDYVRDYIVKNRYVGETIKAEELIK
jgi:hypothetical protein